MAESPAHPIPIAKREAVLLALCLALAGYFLAVRIHAAPLPFGDEGSWLSAAAELADGKGFTTRWLEYHWLRPYQVPRPDDMRFPVLVGLLALGMKAWGPSFVAARMLVAACCLAFIAAAWFAVRLRFGSACAMLTAWLMALSPLLLEWSSAVYCEALFGLVLALWLIAVQKLNPDSLRYGVVSGLLIGVLTLVRPNGILLAAGLAFGAVASLRPFRVRWKPLAAGSAALTLVLLPWFIRNARIFGAPLHVGGSAGLLRESHQDIATRTVGQFFADYGPAYPLLRMFQGVPRFLQALQHYEEGLHILPLLLFVYALIRRRPFYGRAAATGFAVSAAACFYAGYNSWAGVRYFAPFLPFVYACGLAEGLHLLRSLALRFASGDAKWKGGITRMTRFLPAAFALVLAAPVADAHRYYQRHFGSMEGTPFAPVRAWAERVDAEVPRGRPYLGATLCQVNYAGHGLCVGLQGPGREEWLPKALRTFHPGHLALTPEERDGEYGRKLMAELEGLGYRTAEAYRDAIGVLMRLEAVPPAAP